MRQCRSDIVSLGDIEPSELFAQFGVCVCARANGQPATTHSLTLWAKPTRLAGNARDARETLQRFRGQWIARDDCLRSQFQTQLATVLSIVVWPAAIRFAN